MISTCPVCLAELPAPLPDHRETDWTSCWKCASHFHGARSGTEATDVRIPTVRVPAASDEQLGSVLTRFNDYRLEGRLLDVGFGEGQILHAAAAEGWQCWGTETSRAALEVGRRKGWRVLSGDLCRIGLPEALFDVVCMTHILEYLDQPVAYLREAIRLLRPGGLLYLATASTQIAASQPAAQHQTYLQLFTATAVRLALDAAGYTRQHISVGPSPFGTPPARLSNSHPGQRRLFSFTLRQFFRACPGGERLTAFAERPR